MYITFFTTNLQFVKFFHVILFRCHYETTRKCVYRIIVYTFLVSINPCRTLLEDLIINRWKNGSDKLVFRYYYIPSSEIHEFPCVVNFDIITSDDINFHFHFLT